MTDVYKVGVSLVLSGNFAQVLGALSQKLLGINTQVKELEGGFSRLKVVIGSALGVFASTKAVETLASMVKYGDQLIHQQNLMLAQGMTQQQSLEAINRAYQVSAQIQTANVAEVARHIRELNYAMGDIGKAQAMSKVVEQANAVMGSVGGHDYSDQVWDIVKGGEITNRNVDMNEFTHYIDMMTKLYTASGGKVTPQQIFQSFKYGRTAALGWDDSFIGGALGRAIQSMGGGSGGGGGRAGPGNALMSAYAAIVGEQTTKKAVSEFKELGMYQGKGIAGADLFQKNPYEWVQQVLVPDLAKRGINTPEAVTKEISKIFPNRTASQIITEFATQGRAMMGENSNYEKDIRMQGGAMGLSAFDMLMNKDYQTNLKAFNEQWTSFLQSVGSALVPTAIDVLKSFTGIFTDLTKLAQLHPQAIAEIGKAIGALAVGLGVISGAALVAALGPLVGAGGLIAGVAAALGVLAASHWSEIKSGLEGVASSLASLGEKLKNWFQNANPGIMGPGNINYNGGGSFIPASYTTGGGSYTGGGGTDYSGGVASNPASSVGRSVSRSIGGGGSNAGASPMGGAVPNFAPSNATGNAWIAAQRAGFAKELQDPNFRLLAGAVIHAEQPEAGPAVIESAMNRALYGHKTLRQTLTGAFYGPIRHGYIGQHIAALQRNPALRARMNAAIDAALAGSNVIEGHSDQGGPGDPNYLRELHGSHKMFGHEVYGDWPQFSAAQRAFQEHALKSRPPDQFHGNAAYSNWQWHHNFSSEHSPVGPTSGNEVHVHHATYLDGRQIAKNSMKHMAKMGSGRVSGARLTDFSGTRPAEV